MEEVLFNNYLFSHFLLFVKIKASCKPNSFWNPPPSKITARKQDFSIWIAFFVCYDYSYPRLSEESKLIKHPRFVSQLFASHSFFYVIDFALIICMIFTSGDWFIFHSQTIQEHNHSSVFLLWIFFIYLYFNHALWYYVLVLSLLIQ